MIKYTRNMSIDEVIHYAEIGQLEVTTQELVRIFIDAKEEAYEKGYEEGFREGDEQSADRAYDEGYAAGKYDASIE